MRGRCVRQATPNGGSGDLIGRMRGCAINADLECMFWPQFLVHSRTSCKWPRRCHASASCCCAFRRTRRSPPSMIPRQQAWLEISWLCAVRCRALQLLRAVRLKALPFKRERCERRETRAHCMERCSGTPVATLWTSALAQHSCNCVAQRGNGAFALYL